MSIFSLLTGETLARTGLGMYRAGEASSMQIGQYRQQAVSSRWQAKQAALQGRIDAVRVIEQLNKQQAANMANAYARGVTYSGSIKVADQAASREADWAVEMKKLNTKLKTSELMRKAKDSDAYASALRSHSNTNRALGIMSAAAGLFLM